MIVRGILLRGASLPDLCLPLVTLLVFSAVMLSFAVRRFRKRLE